MFKNIREQIATQRKAYSKRGLQICNPLCNFFFSNREKNLAKTNLSMFYKQDQNRLSFIETREVLEKESMVLGYL